MLNFVKKFRLIIILVLFVGLSFSVGFSYGIQQTQITNTVQSVKPGNEIAKDKSIDMAAFWKVWNTLDEKFVQTHKNASSTTDEDRVWGAISGMTAALGDPYTVFMPPEESQDFKTNLSGNFEGIGMEIDVKDGVLSVISPLKGSPAEKAGLKTGDKIIAINDTPSADFSVDRAVKMIRGPKDTTVKITVMRSGASKSIDFIVTRAVINIPSVDTELRDDVFIIELHNFYGESRSQFNKALKEFVKSKKNKLIIDLRGNPGGYLDTAVDMASWFLPTGTVIVRENFGENSSTPEKVYRSKGYDIFTDKLQMIILVDGGSASASEILAGALVENGKAKLVGTKTFGKGSVQELIQITDDTSLKVTVAKWLTPKGKSISEDGLTPEYDVKITEADIKAGRDPQLDKALELLKDK